MPAAAAEIVVDVKVFGSFPQRAKRPQGEAECAENLLATRYADQKGSIPKAVPQELELLRPLKDAAEQVFLECLAFIEKHGRRPVESRKDSQEEALEHNVRKLASGFTKE